jgi:uncharacterized membrane protein YgcG
MSSYGVRENVGAGERIMDAVSRNPEGLLLLAAGCALLMRSGRGGSRQRHAEIRTAPRRQGQTKAGAQGSEPGIGDRVGEVARRAGEYVSDATERASDTARHYATSAAEYSHEAASDVMEKSRRVANQAQQTADYVVRHQPWTVALAGALAGAALAAIFPSTRLERRALGDIGGRLRDATETAGERLMEAGMQAGGRLKDVAEEHGLTREGLKDAARDVGETFTSTLAGKDEKLAQQENEKAASSKPHRGPSQQGSGGERGVQSNRSTSSGGGSSGGHGGRR